MYMSIETFISITLNNKSSIKLQSIYTYYPLSLSFTLSSVNENTEQSSKFQKSGQSTKIKIIQQVVIKVNCYLDKENSFLLSTIHNVKLQVNE